MNQIAIERASQADEAIEAFRARYRSEAIPRRYDGRLHFLFTIAVSLGVFALLLSRVQGPSLREAAAAPLFLLFCSAVEYLEHRYILHRVLRGLSFAYRIHTLEHHRFFTHDRYAPESHRDLFFVLFPPRLVVGYQVLLVAPFAAGFGLLVSPNVGYLVGAAGSLFFFLYEVVHFLSHVVPDRAGPPGLGWLFRHHRLHHDPALMGKANFNVVFPVFDWLVGTARRAARK